MAVEKDITIKGGMNGYAAIKRAIDYVEDDHHHTYNSETVIDYAENPDKTTLRDEFIQKGEDRLKADYIKKTILISSVVNGETSRRLDAVDFMEDKKRYEIYKAGDRRGMGRVDKGKANNRDAYHVIQSFNESCEELDPRLVHQIQRDRDPYVSEYVKRRAKGICDLCRNPAPFKDSKGRPYLESHHVKWLSEGGSDIIENAVALCPNCHKKMHILNEKKDIENLYFRLEQYGVFVIE